MLNEIKDVGASVWISASAGTGKTKSLIDRILALLLNGATPSRILCLTYTKAAATEMLTRLSSLVQRFASLSASELLNELEILGFGKIYINTARKLYEKSLISSEWVQIKTIHSFCFGILEKFPIETGLMPGVNLCDDYEKMRFLNQAIEKVIFQDNYRRFSEFISRFTIDISEIFSNNFLKLQKFLSKFDNFESLYCDFFYIKNREFLFSENKDAFLINESFNGAAQQIFQELAEILSSGKKEDIKKSEILQKNAQKLSEDFIYAFLTKDFKPKLCGKKLSDIYPNLLEKMQEAAQKTLRFCEKKNRYISAEANIALFSVVEKILFEFNELKRKNHCIDFDDVISMTSGLLNNIDWVMFKIDNNIDHLLVDEAQDTSPEQWEIINTITDEFFANYGSEKTIFVVGDEKQSIYSFQGADVQIFQKMRKKFEQRSRASGQRFHNVDLNKSYRTTGNILSFVDDVFKNTKHYTNRPELAGVVDIVDLFEDEKNEKDEDIWEVKTEVESISIMTAEKKLAKYIADFIKNSIDSRIFVESKNRAAKASDFMILFQRRDVHTMREIIKALRKNNIAVSGIDRSLLKNEIIVEDLIALAQFAIFPLDDLICARVLKSPVIGISDDELMRVCLEREEKGLWEHCLQNPELCRKYRLQELQKIIDQALCESAYTFFSHALTNGLKEKFILRLGEKCLEGLYDFIDVVMNYEKEHTASLQSFLQWFRTFGNEIEIKRESFSCENCVRLMTVHASKGLQAPFVLLADTHFYRTKNEKILKTDDGILLWNFSSDFRTNEMQKLCAEYDKYEVAESKRRLYVALTRAEDYVCILGQNQEKRRNNCWYDLIKSEMNAEKFKETKICEQKLLRFGDFSIANNNESDKFPVIEEKEKNDIAIPNWFYEKLDLSAALAEELDLIQTEQMTYGDCVHLLLSELPKYGNSFEMFADAFVDRFDLSDLLKESAKKEAFKILSDEKLHFIFADDSLSEVTFADRNGKEGRIDKIVFVNDDIWIIDFKTGSYQEEIPQKYVEQLEKYKRFAMEAFNTHKDNVKTAILWTANAKLVDVDDVGM